MFKTNPRLKTLLVLIFLLGLFLRLYSLAKVPPALYWDEASLGYNAYSISQTGQDEFGVSFPLDKFIAFGDYKPPLYIYSIAPFINLLGLSELAVRLPSALAGSFLVLVAYFLSLELFVNSHQKKKIALLAALVVAVSPWSLQLSRAGFEANFAATLSALGLLFLLKLIRTSSWYYVPFAGLFLVLPFYTFNSQRIFIPLICAAVVLTFRRGALTNWPKILVLAGLSVILLVPIIPHLLSREASLRLQEVAWVNDVNPIVLANNRVTLDGGGTLAKILHNRRLVYAGEFLSHFSDNFTANYLFKSGDPNPKLSDQYVGEFYWFDLIPLLGGIYFLIRQNRWVAVILLAWWLLGTIPAALARETPHALRTVNVLPAPQIIIAYGVVSFFSLLNNRRVIMLTSLVVPTALTVTLFAALYYYFQIYPAKYALNWQYGYKQMVQEVWAIHERYPGVEVTDAYGRPYIYFLFYNQISPHEYWSTVSRSRDWFGLWTVHSLGNIYFSNDNRSSGWLYVKAPGPIPPGAKMVDRVTGPGGEIIFNIYSR